MTVDHHDEITLPFGPGGIQPVVRQQNEKRDEQRNQKIRAPARPQDTRPERRVGIPDATLMRWLIRRFRSLGMEPERRVSSDQGSAR